jgi:hypothetical protein
MIQYVNNKPIVYDEWKKEEEMIDQRKQLIMDPGMHKLHNSNIHGIVRTLGIKILLNYVVLLTK